MHSTIPYRVWMRPSNPIINVRRPTLSLRTRVACALVRARTHPDVADRGPTAGHRIRLTGGRFPRPSHRCMSVAAWPPHDRWRRRLTSSRSLSSHGRCLASSRSLASPPDLLAFAVSWHHVADHYFVHTLRVQCCSSVRQGGSIGWPIGRPPPAV